MKPELSLLEHFSDTILDEEKIMHERVEVLECHPIVGVRSLQERLEDNKILP